MKNVGEEGLGHEKDDETDDSERVMNLRSRVLLGVTAAVGAAALFLSLRSHPDEKKAAEEARRSLRQQGFKTDLTEFNFSTSDELRSRAAALTNIGRLRPIRPIVLFQPCGPDCAVVAWKQRGSPEQEVGYQSLPSVDESTAENRAELDAARAAALAGPIRFELTAARGIGMALPHLSSVRGLAGALAALVVFELREHNDKAAWTNLLALTRLSTAWEPEPVEVSQMVRFNLSRTAWKAAWQALQAHEWTDDQLAALQREWEATDFFRCLPETMAFLRASIVAFCITQRQTSRGSGMNLKETQRTILQSPSYIWTGPRESLKRAHYRKRGTYQDEKDLLLFFRDREVELRQALSSPTWSQMRALPGVTNPPQFRSRDYFSGLQVLANNRFLAGSYYGQGKSMLEGAVETEARRRLLVTAVALERYRRAHDSYPTTLEALVPRFLKSVPPDFVDGLPLRYRLTQNGEFVLYSIGLDCVDDGGTLNPSVQGQQVYPQRDRADGPDLVWPRPGSEAELQAFWAELRAYQEECQRAGEQNELSLARRAAEQERSAELRRQAIFAELEKLYARQVPRKMKEPKVQGRPLSDVLRNQAVSLGTAPTVKQMLTLRQITTGQEPDIATFELPISYDALTNLGTLRLLCDADPKDSSSDDQVEVQELARATNGNCRLIWNTTYDPPGKHFLQAQLECWHTGRRWPWGGSDEETIELRGPLFSFLSTNVLQFTPRGCVYTEKGAFFSAKLARSNGCYAIEITSPSGKHVHTIKGSTSNSLVGVHWDLLDDTGHRYTNSFFNSSWTVTFPDPAQPSATNSP